MLKKSHRKKLPRVIDGRSPRETPNERHNPQRKPPRVVEKRHDTDAESSTKLTEPEANSSRKPTETETEAMKKPTETDTN